MPLQGKLVTDIKGVFMRKTLLLFFAFCFTFFASAQTRRENADIVIMMDTSGTILPYYDSINKRVLNEINSKFVRIGDVVHLISFDAKARHEISQKIESEADLSRIVSRFMLLYQLGNKSDLLTALDYAKNFTDKLESSKKEKILIIISDGIFNPPLESKYANYSGEKIKNKISSIANDIRNENWKVYFVKVPFPDHSIIRNLDGEVIAEISSTKEDSDKLNKPRTLKSEKESGTEYGTNSSDSTEPNFATAVDSQADSKNTDTSTSGKDDTSLVQKSVDTNDKTEDFSRKNSDVSAWDTTANEAVATKKNDGANGFGKESDKEYTDISDDITNSLGIKKSELSKDGPFSIADDDKNVARITFPQSLVVEGKNFKLPLQIKNESAENMLLDLKSISIFANGKTSELPLDHMEAIKIPAGETVDVNVLAKVFRTILPIGTYDSEIKLNFADNKAVLPQAAQLSLDVRPSGFESLYKSGRLWLYLVFAVLILFLLLLLLFFYLRRNTSNPVPNALRSSAAAESLNDFGSNSHREARHTAMSSGEYAKRLAEKNREEARARSALLNQSSGSYSPQYHEEHLRVKRNQSGMTEIYVFKQTRSIGKRNIHVMKPGSQLSVGGGKRDDFLIFLVKLPANLANVRYDGHDYHLHINKAKYFPYVKGNVVDNCIGKTITVVSDKGYHIGFTFREYEDPISNLNNILTSIDYT